MSVIEWPPMTMSVGAAARIDCAPLPHIHRAQFTIGIAKTPEGVWAHPSLVQSVRIVEGHCVEPLLLPVTALHAAFPKAGVAWLLARAATGVVVARARLTLT